MEKLAGFFASTGLKLKITPPAGVLAFLILGGLLFSPAVVRAENPLSPARFAGPECFPPISTSSGAPFVQACISDNNPRQSSTVLVFGRLINEGKAVPALKMKAHWKFKFFPADCTGISDLLTGIGQCSHDIGNATKDYNVVVEVSFDFQNKTYRGVTSFTTRDKNFISAPRVPVITQDVPVIVSSPISTFSTPVANSTPGAKLTPGGFTPLVTVTPLPGFRPTSGSSPSLQPDPTAAAAEPLNPLPFIISGLLAGLGLVVLLGWINFRNRQAPVLKGHQVYLLCQNLSGSWPVKDQLAHAAFVLEELEKGILVARRYRVPESILKPLSRDAQKGLGYLERMAIRLKDLEVKTNPFSTLSARLAGDGAKLQGLIETTNQWNTRLDSLTLSSGTLPGELDQIQDSLYRFGQSVRELE